MRILIAGTGSIGQRHIRNIRAIEPGARFIFLRAERRYDALADELDAEVVADMAEAAVYRPDLAVIATPSALHTELVMGCIKYGIPFYIEKPVVITEADVRQIREKLKRSKFNAPTQVGCNLRFLPSLQKARQLIEEGALGRIARASFQAGQWLPDWRPQQDYRKSYSADPARGGGVLMDLIHEIDAARMLLGEFNHVLAMTARFEPLQIESESVASVMLSGQGNGPLVTVGLDYVSRCPVRRYEVIGDQANLVWDLPAQTLTLQRPGESRVVTDRAEEFDVAQTYITAMHEFISAIRSGEPTSQGIEEGLRSTELAIAAKGNV